MGQKQKFLVVDTETCTINQNFNGLKKPLVYNIGWKIVDRKGNEYAKKSYIVNEIFFNREAFSTAYYKEKRKFYIREINENRLVCKNWNEIYNEFLEDTEKVDFVCAFNASFDLKKAIPFTNRYMEKLYSEDFEEWVYNEEKNANFRRKNSSSRTQSEFLMPYFNGKDVICIWNLAINEIFRKKSYLEWAEKNEKFSESKKFYSSNVENCIQFLDGNLTYSENHTAIEDVNDEIRILLKCLYKRKAEKQLEAFPFRVLKRKVKISENYNNLE